MIKCLSNHSNPETGSLLRACVVLHFRGIEFKVILFKYIKHIIDKLVASALQHLEEFRVDGQRLVVIFPLHEEPVALVMN